MKPFHDRLAGPQRRAAYSLPPLERRWRDEGSPRQSELPLRESLDSQPEVSFAEHRYWLIVLPG